MAFVVRQLARRADGGDVIRTRSIAATEINVGRGSDCDVRIADLGVMLRHLRLSVQPDGRVAATATGGLPIEIAGAFVNHADLDVASRPVIDIAGHRLTLAPGDTACDIVVTAERIATNGDAGVTEAADLFTLRGVAPSKRLMAWGFLLVVLGGLLAWPLWSRGAPPGRRADIVWNSGPLSVAHAKLAGNCGACHQAAFVSVTDAACQACHKPSVVPAHAAAGRMAQGRVPATGLVADVHERFGLPAGRCASCHGEHEGPQGALLVAADYCTDCHAGLSTRLSDTALSNVENWPQHPQFRATLATAPGRSQRVTLPARERSGLVFGHKLHLSATNAVANMAQAQGLATGALGCGYCHTPDRAGVRFKPIEMERNCGACHDLALARDDDSVRMLPHGKPAQVIETIRDLYRSGGGGQPAGRRAPGIGGGGLRAARADAAIAGIFGPRGVCADCHGVVTGRADGYDIAPVKLTNHYLPKGDFPHKRHKMFGKASGEAACAGCHSGVAQSAAATDVLVPPVAMCRTCHGKKAATQPAPAACETCHAFHYGAGDSWSQPGQRRVVAGTATMFGGASGG